MTSEIERYYKAGVESARLRTGTGKLERKRTHELMDRFLPPPPAVIYDVGGGTGVYAFRLAGKRHRVHLLDVVPVHIDMARTAMAAGALPVLAEAIVGDARSLPWPDESADAVLLLGPLYHLTGRGDRLACLKAAMRVLRPGGILLASAISRFASALDGIRMGYLADPEFAAIVERDLADGQHRNPTGHPEYFMAAHFHHPDELGGEVARAGFSVDGVFGIEGPGWLAQDFDAWWGDRRRRERLIQLARRLETEPALAGISAHLLAAARKP
jgi:ubiquinone/menaquinone biosynthesis C-methylase UbiE